MIYPRNPLEADHLSREPQIKKQDVFVA